MVEDQVISKEFCAGLYTLEVVIHESKEQNWALNGTLWNIYNHYTWFAGKTIDYYFVSNDVGSFLII